jgi:hypothetical protein
LLRRNAILCKILHSEYEGIAVFCTNEAFVVENQNRGADRNPAADGGAMESGDVLDGEGRARAAGGEC